MVQNLIKLSVGTDSVEDLYLWQQGRIFNWPDGCGGRKAVTIRTRHKPKAEAEILKGGSIYWVIRNVILVRQRIIGFEPYMLNGVPDVKVVLDPQLVHTVPVPRKAFQGWRYLPGDQAPPDRGPYIYGEKEGTLSPEMEQALAATGLL
jgi:hypothetical protein